MQKENKVTTGDYGWQKEVCSMVDISDIPKYKSASIHAEVKLAEALNRCTQLCVDANVDTKGQKPNKLKTAVCCECLLS